MADFRILSVHHEWMLGVFVLETMQAQVRFSLHVGSDQTAIQFRDLFFGLIRAAGVSPRQKATFLPYLGTREQCPLRCALLTLGQPSRRF